MEFFGHEILALDPDPYLLNPNPLYNVLLYKKVDSMKQLFEVEEKPFTSSLNILRRAE